MNWLIDTNVLSEPSKPSPSFGVRQWLLENEQNLHVSVITLAEIESGLLRLPDGKRKARLLQWYEVTSESIKVVDFDHSCASNWARLHTAMLSEGRVMSLFDSLIAATALAHNMTIVTRNTRDFEASGVPTINPF